MVHTLTIFRYIQVFRPIEPKLLDIAQDVILLDNFEPMQLAALPANSSPATLLGIDTSWLHFFCYQIGKS